MLEEILELHKQGQLEEAERRYRELLTFNPDDPETLHLLGMVRRQRGDFREGVQLVQRAIELAPDRANYHGTLAGMLFHARAFDRAREHFEQAVTLNPNFHGAYAALGQIAMLQNDPGRAEQQFKLALKAAPEQPQVLTSLGNLLLARGETESALQHLNRAAQLQPDDLATQASLGRALLRAGHAAFAEQALRNALAKKPDFHGATLLLAEALTAQRRGDEARALLQPLLGDPGSGAAARAAMGDVSRAEGNLRAAVVWYREALTRKRAQPGVMGSLAWCLATLGHREQAVAAYREYLAAVPEDAGSRRALAALLAELGRREESAAELRVLVGTPEGGVEARAALAATLEQNGDLDGAAREAEAALASAPQQPVATLVLARAALRAGDAAGAQARLAALDDVALGASQRRVLAALRGHAADRLGDPASAVDHWLAAHRAGGGRSLPAMSAPPAALADAIADAQTAGPIGASRVPRALLLGAPGSGVERVAALLADAPELLLLNDRFGADPRHDEFTAPDFGRYLASLDETEARLFARHYAKPLERGGLPPEAGFVDWLPHFDARVLPAVLRALGPVPLIAVARAPQAQLLQWLAFGSPQAALLEDPVGAARWLSLAARQIDAARVAAAQPVLVLDADAVSADPAAAVAALAATLGMSAWDPGAAFARSGLVTGGLPAQFPADRHRAYAGPLAAAFAVLAGN